LSRFAFVPLFLRWPYAHASAACRAQGWLFAYNAATLQQVGAHAARSACSP